MIKLITQEKLHQNEHEENEVNQKSISNASIQDTQDALPLSVLQETPMQEFFEEFYPTTCPLFKDVLTPTESTPTNKIGNQDETEDDITQVDADFLSQKAAEEFSLMSSEVRNEQNEPIHNIQRKDNSNSIEDIFLSNSLIQKFASKIVESQLTIDDFKNDPDIQIVISELFDVSVGTANLICRIVNNVLKK